jgi:hypothetical protein
MCAVKKAAGEPKILRFLKVDAGTESLLRAIRLIRRGYDHATIISVVFGDAPYEQVAGRRALRRLRRLGFSVAAERNGKTDFSRHLIAIVRELRGQPDHEIEAAIDELLSADEPNLRRLLAEHASQ